jgi:hypothetical protein
MQMYLMFSNLSQLVNDRAARPLILHQVSYLHVFLSADEPGEMLTLADTGAGSSQLLKVQ